MTDTVVRNVPYVVQYNTGRGGKVTRERHGVPVTLPVAPRFDEAAVAVTRKGERVDLGRLDGRAYVRVPWEVDVAPQGRVKDAHGTLLLFDEHDPTCGTTRMGRVVRAGTLRLTGEVPTVADPMGGPRVPLGLGRQERDDIERRVETWAGAGVVVDGGHYVPTSGVSVHLIKNRDGLTVPALEFGWSGMRRTASMVDEWIPGWEPYGGWGEGTLQVPDGFGLDPVAAHLARAVDDGFWSHDWGTWRRVEDGYLPVARLRDVHDTGDVAAFAARLTDFADRGEGRVGLHLTRAVAAMSPDLRERFDAHLAGVPHEPAPTELDGLTFGP